MTAYDDLMAFQRETEALAQVAGRLGWDQETVMPRGAAPQRGEEMAAMESVLHARRIDPRIADWLGRMRPVSPPIWRRGSPVSPPPPKAHGPRPVPPTISRPSLLP